MKYVLVLFVLLFSQPAWAQDAAAPTATRNEAVEQLITVLDNDQLRQQLLEQLRALPATAPTTAPVIETPTPPVDGLGEAPTQPGLVDAVTQWSNQLVQSLPTTTFGMPIDQKAQQAGAQVASRLEAGLGDGQLLAFLLWAVPGLALLALGGVLVRRIGRRLVAPSRPLRKRRLALGIALRLVAHIAVFFIVLVLIGRLSPGESGVTAFLTLAIGLVVAQLSADVVISGLSLMSAWRGRRIVHYCQVRFYPWVLTGALTAIFAALTQDATLRRVIGWSAADIAGFALNLVTALLVIVFVYRHKLAIGRLIFGAAARQPSSTHPLKNATRNLARRWTLLAYSFLILSIVSIIAGQRDNDILTLMLWSFGAVLVCLTAISILNRFFEPRRQVYRTGRNALHQVTGNAVMRVLRLAADTTVILVTLIAVARIWGFDLWHWVVTDGRPITGPLLAAAACVAMAWLVWVALDAWIANALTPAGGPAWTHRRSSRVQTLLPLIRNGVMIVLIVLAGIAVLANIGVDVTPLIAGAGVFGLALSFGSQQLVQDVITGIFILAEDTIAIGDTISTGDRSGVVESISLRTIRLRDEDGALHSIPFSTVKALKNSSRNFGVLRPRYTVPAAVDPELVMEEMRLTASELREDPRYAAAITGELNDLGVDEINTGAVVISGALRTTPRRQTEVARAFNGKLLQRLGEKGVTL